MMPTVSRIPVPVPKSAQEVGARCNGAYDDSSHDCYRGYVAVENLSDRGAGTSESFYLHSRVDQLFCYGLRIHSAHLDPCHGEEDACEDEYAHVDGGSDRILENDGDGSRGERVVCKSLARYELRVCRACRDEAAGEEAEPEV